MKHLNCNQGEDTKARALLSLLLEKGLTVAFAESCTGGLVSQRITAIPGSSAALLGGVVSYSNSVKERVLSVGGDTLNTCGAVSEKCALEMCEGVRRLCQSSIAVSVTGIAGPGGGTAEKPVGTVCFGLCFGESSYTETAHFPETLSREEIRSLSADRAIELCIEAAKQIKV